MKRINHRNTGIYLLLGAAVSGIAMFIATWNSYLVGAGKSLISLVFLLMYLSCLAILYFKWFNNFSSTLKRKDSDNDSYSREENLNSGPGLIDSLPRENRTDLLKGVSNSADSKTNANKVLRNLAHEFDIVQGVFFIFDNVAGKFTHLADYGCFFENPPSAFEAGEGLSGQAVVNHKILIIPNLPASYSPVVSGLGKGKAKVLYIIPLIHEKRSQAVIEITCFTEIEEGKMSALNHLMRDGGSKFSSVLSHETK